MKFFGFDLSDFIPCEICGQRSVDINHINGRGMGGRGNEAAQKQSDSIENLMAMCRRHHEKYGDKKQYTEYIKTIHTNYIQTKQPLNIDEL